MAPTRVVRLTSSDPGKDPREDARRELFRLVVEENGKRPLRVARANTRGVPVGWWTTDTYEPHDLRCVLGTETVFDIGDTAPHWEEVQMTTNTLWEILREQNVPFWGALSGGKGTHTHVFVHPGDKRVDFVAAILGMLRDRLEQDEVDVDPGHLYPPFGAKIVREFGARKYNPKTLYTGLGAPERPLLSSRSKCYEVAGVVIPTALPVAEQPVGAFHRIVAETVGGMCPRTPECFDPQLSAYGGVCSDCPANR